MGTKDKIMVIEDDQLYSSLMSYVLEQAGYRVVVATSLAAALAMIDGQCAAITLDLSLPDSRGPETLIRLRGRHPEVPIVVISGHVTEYEFLNLIALGADTCIQKPPEIETILFAVNRAIKMRDHEGVLEVLKIYEQSLAHI